jgi:hypothetical protein
MQFYTYVLTATWVPERLENANQLCAALSEVGPCVVVPAPRGDTLTDSDVDGLQREGLISLAPTPKPRGLVLPRPLRPLGAEFDANQMVVSPRGRKIVGNTVGIIRILQHVVATAAAADARAGQDGEAPSAGMTFLVLEDDAQLVATQADFGARLRALLAHLPRGQWHALSLTPPPGMCGRARRLPWFPRRSGIVTPRLSFSRTTAIAYTADGAAALLSTLPAANTVDLWIRQAVRARQLRMRIHCGMTDADGVFTFGDVSNRQV